VTIFVCWVLFPLLLGALCLGCGLLLEQLSGARIPGPILPAAGLAVIIVVVHFTTLGDATAELSVPLVVALAVALNIVVTGVSLIRRASAGLMDHALSTAEQEVLLGTLEPYRQDGVVLHSIRTRRAGQRSFVSLHVLVPGDWTVQQGHDLSERLEADIRSVLPGSWVTTHTEPIEDPSSLDDAEFERLGPRA
jgi:divalent metal cation (Fe/Co/Zn/Cd) transporter